MIGLRRVCCLAWVSVLLANPMRVDAQIDFNITFDDVVNGTGVGFDDPVLGADRRATVIAVADYLNTVLDENGIVDITIENSQTDGAGFLAAAGPLFPVGAPGFTNGLVFENATTGVDIFPSDPDATATFDFGFNYNSQLDAPTATEFDLFTVTLHEFTHALGFLSILESDGTSGLTGETTGTFSVFDSLLVRGDGTALFGPGGEFIGSASDLTSRDVFFSGANAVAANGGELVEIFAPGSFQDGSSLSHLDAGSFPTAVSQPTVAPGVQRREFLPVEVGLLQDLGFSVAFTAVPEPSATTLLLLCAYGLFARRRRS